MVGKKQHFSRRLPSKELRSVIPNGDTQLLGQRGSAYHAQILTKKTIEHVFVSQLHLMWFINPVKQTWVWLI